METIKLNGNLFYAEDGTPKEMILTGIDLNNELVQLEKSGIKSIWINHAFCDGRIKDLSFLQDIPFVEKIGIVGEVFNQDGLYSLKGLKHIQIDNGKGIHFSEFNNLISLTAGKLTDFSLPNNLERLHLWHTKIPEKSLTHISFPGSLTDFELLFSDIIDCTGLPQSISHLSLSYCRNLTSLNGLERVASRLTYLNLDHCRKLSDYSSLTNCWKLHKLMILDCTKLENLSLIKDMKELEFFSFYGTEVMDNDLTPLFAIPAVGFKDKKTYNHKLSHFKKEC